MRDQGTREDGVELQAETANFIRSGQRCTGCSQGHLHKTTQKRHVVRTVHIAVKW